MDTLAALNFGMIVALNIREKGLDGEKKVMGETIRAGWIAGGVLLAVYGMLAFLGMVSSQHFAGNTNGTETLTDMMNFLFGNVGAVLLAVVFVIACFNTCVGLFSCCGNYFSKVFPKISYRNWVFLFAFVSLIIANVGLNAILKFSVPVLNAIYPLAILLIFLSCIHQWIAKDPLVYPIAAVFCGVSSLVVGSGFRRGSDSLCNGSISDDSGVSGGIWLDPSYGDRRCDRLPCRKIQEEMKLWDFGCFYSLRIC